MSSKKAKSQDKKIIERERARQQNRQRDRQIIIQDCIIMLPHNTNDIAKFVFE